MTGSWRNKIQLPVHALHKAGHDVYDFKNPREDNNKFQWSKIDPNWQKWTVVFVEGQPFGHSASLEMGWGAGNG